MKIPIPNTMTAVLLTGHGKFEKLEYRNDFPVPVPGPMEVLIQVGAAGINNTDINTRIAWYSKNVTSDTHTGSESGFTDASEEDASWSGEPIKFPRIQGADCCGRIVAIGNQVDPHRMGERVLVRPIQTTEMGSRAFACRTFGSECDGGFAQYTRADAGEAVKIESDLSDIELASVPCA